MASFRGLVLAFVRDYIETYGLSPSYGEIAASIQGATRRRVRDAILSLVRDGKLIKVARQRGLRLPSAHDEAVRVLREQGYTVEEAKRLVAYPDGPDFTLLPPPALTYPKRRQEGSKDDST